MSGPPSPPATWLMMGHKAGDNNQLLALAEALGWPYEIKRLVYRRTEIVTNLFAGPTLAGLVKARSSPLAPPWPELIISAGRRNEPLVRWIQARAMADEPDRPPPRLVHVGRPWALHECFDLIVTTPQYRLPEKPNILHNEAPMHRVRRERLEAAAAAWRPRLAHLPEPHIAVIIGGNAGPYVLDRENAALLAHHASAMAREQGGSLLVTTSARTPKKAIDAFAATLGQEGGQEGAQARDVPHHLYRWRPDDPDNPYFAFLALADRHIVTADSMSMLIEACVTGRPVHLFDFARRPGSRRPPLPRNRRLVGSAPLERLADFSLQPLVFRLGFKLAPRRLTRDVTIIHDRMVESGRAVWLGEPWPGDRPPPPPLVDTERAAEAVRRLFAEPPPPRPERPPSRLPEWLQRFAQG